MRVVILAAALLAVACSSEKEGVSDVAAPGELQITHLRQGTGRSPSATDVVAVHYHGTFPDGRVFDSSVERGEPSTFPLSGVIPCWTQGLQQMKVGGKAKLVCPASLAYGERGHPPSIPPNATLVFEVDLLAVQ